MSTIANELDTYRKYLSDIWSAIAQEDKAHESKYALANYAVSFTEAETTKVSFQAHDPQGHDRIRATFNQYIQKYCKFGRVRAFGHYETSIETETQWWNPDYPAYKRATPGIIFVSQTILDKPIEGRSPQTARVQFRLYAKPDRPEYAADYYGNGFNADFLWPGGVNYELYFSTDEYKNIKWSKYDPLNQSSYTLVTLDLPYPIYNWRGEEQTGCNYDPNSPGGPAVSYMAPVTGPPIRINTEHEALLRTPIDDSVFDFWLFTGLHSGEVIDRVVAEGRYRDFIIDTSTGQPAYLPDGLNLALISKALRAIKDNQFPVIKPEQIVSPYDTILTDHTANYEYWLNEAWDAWEYYIGSTVTGTDKNLRNLRNLILQKWGM